jgi:CheY-like chemotaxis protein
MRLGSKILVIDDEPEVQQVLKFILEREGYKIETAANGIEALALLNAETFSLVVCDLTMPQMDGLALLKALRAEKNHVPFIFLSGNVDETAEHEMANYGTFKLIEKPDFDAVRIATKA